MAVTAAGCRLGATNNATGAPPPAKPAEAPLPQTFNGTLRTGIMAIGGETTGIVLETPSGRYELDVSGSPQAAAKVDQLAGKKVTVLGDYRPRPGVEVKERRIIVVRELREAR